MLFETGDMQGALERCRAYSSCGGAKANSKWADCAEDEPARARHQGLPQVCEAGAEEPVHPRRVGAKCLSPTLKLYKEAEEHLREALALDPDQLNGLSGWRSSSSRRAVGATRAGPPARQADGAGDRPASRWRRRRSDASTPAAASAGGAPTFSTALRVPKLRANPQLRAQIERALRRSRTANRGGL